MKHLLKLVWPPMLEVVIGAVLALITAKLLLEPLLSPDEPVPVAVYTTGFVVGILVMTAYWRIKRGKTDEKV